MRTLSFDQPIRYSICFEALTLLPAQAFPLQQGEIDDHVSIVRKLKQVGTCKNPERTRAEPPIYEYTAGSVRAENSEFDLLKRMVLASGSYIARHMTEEFRDTRDWLAQIPLDAE